jgi:hypothetical protein
MGLIKNFGKTKIHEQLWIGQASSGSNQVDSNTSYELTTLAQKSGQ